MWHNKELTNEFSRNVGEGATPTSDSSEFVKYLTDYFSAADAEKICTTLSNLQRPLPGDDAFLKGTDGCIVFDEEYGVVIRIEKKSVSRIIHPLVLQPLASIETEKSIIEICPGVHTNHDHDIPSFLHKKLKSDQLNFFDDQTANTGKLPFSTSEFPEGVPLVIDRPAVRQLSDEVSLVKKYIPTVCNIFNPKSRKPEEIAQDVLYAPLRKLFHDAWPDISQKQPDAKKIARFWRECRNYTKQGKLVAGWKNKPGGFWKQCAAVRCSSAYAASPR